MLKHIILSILIFFNTSCSLYESGGRETIRDNKSNLVGAYDFGTTADGKFYYLCANSKATPDFLREPLEVIETKYNHSGYSALMPHDTQTNWLIVYSIDDEDKSYNHCRLYSNSSHKIHTHSAIRAGVSLLQQIQSIPRTRKGT